MLGDDRQVVVLAHEGIVGHDVQSIPRGQLPLADGAHKAGQVEDPVSGLADEIVRVHGFLAAAASRAETAETGVDFKVTK